MTSPDGGPALHPRLASDCHRLGTLNDTQLLLHRNSALHWFILVPATPVLDLTDLSADEQQQLLSHATLLGNLLKRELDYPRVNIGALGLVVPQLHLHVIGRRQGDPCWPGPVWGALPDAGPYGPEAIDQVKALLNTLPGFMPPA